MKQNHSVEELPNNYDTSLASTLQNSSKEAPSTTKHKYHMSLVKSSKGLNASPMIKT